MCRPGAGHAVAAAFTLSAAVLTWLPFVTAAARCLQANAAALGVKFGSHKAVCY
jgi:hypothetical protein